MNEESLAKEKWTNYLKSLSVGMHTKIVPTKNDLDTITSIGYRMNSKEYEKHYQFQKNYRDKVIVIIVRHNKHGKSNIE